MKISKFLKTKGMSFIPYVEVNGGEGAYIPSLNITVTGTSTCKIAGFLHDVKAALASDGLSSLANIIHTIISSGYECVIATGNILGANPQDIVR